MGHDQTLTLALSDSSQVEQRALSAGRLAEHELRKEAEARMVTKLEACEAANQQESLAWEAERRLWSAKDAEWEQKLVSEFQASEEKERMWAEELAKVGMAHAVERQAAARARQDELEVRLGGSWP